MESSYIQKAQHSLSHAYSGTLDNTCLTMTSESVSAGHADKLCDQMSDALLDLFLAQDPHARVACETLATDNYVIVAGEVRGPFIPRVALDETLRGVIKDVGYEHDDFPWQDVRIDIRLHEQSPDIAQGVDGQEGRGRGAGDQGVMFGYACRDTPLFMPAPIYYAHRLLHAMAQDRVRGLRPELGADAKSQVTLRYEDGKPVGIQNVVVSVQHKEGVSLEHIRALVHEYVRRVFPEQWQLPAGELYVNPTGRFVRGGPRFDTGLTGRKIVVDTYGGAAPHGGGAFSGKDPTKVDRSAAYMARYLARNIVAAGIADRCTIQIAYAIGVAQPLALMLDFHGTGKVTSKYVVDALFRLVDLSQYGIREHLKLDAPIYRSTASYGHFGRPPQENGCFSWEKEDLVPLLLEAL